MKRYMFLILSLFLLLQLNPTPMLYAGTHVRVGVYQNEPLVSLDDNGNARGIYIDILEYVAAKEGWRLEYVPGSWPRCLERLEKAEIDLMTGIAYSEQRDLKYDFTQETLLSNWGQVYTREGSGIESIPDLEGKSIAVLKGDIYYAGFSDIIRRFNIGCSYKEVSDYAGVFRSVAQGKADAGLITRLYGFEHEKGYDVYKSPIICCPVELRFAAPQGRRGNLLLALDSHMVALKADKGSVYYQSFGRWIEGISSPAVPEWLKWALASVAGALFLFIGISVLLRSQVRARTKALQHEISEQKTLEEALRKSEANYRAIYDLANDAIFIHDKETGEILDVNQKMCEMFGYSRQEARQVDVDAFSAGYPPYSQDDALKWMEKAANGQPQLFEWLAKDKDNRLFWVEVNLKKAPIGGKERLIVVARDITQRKKSEEDMRKEMELRETIIQTSPAFFVAINAEGNTIMMNKSMLNSMGYNSDEVVGKNYMTTFVPEGNHEMLSGVFQRLIKDNKPTLNENRVLTRDGRELMVEWHGRSVFDEKGEFDYFFGVGIDITDRKRSDEALKESEERFRVLAESTPSAIMLYQDNKWMYVNPAAEVLTGYLREELLSMDFWDVVHPDFKQLIKDRGGARQKGLSALSRYEFKIISKDGQEKWVDLAGAATMLGGSPAGIITVIDITDRKRSEEALKESEERYRTVFETSASAMAILEEDMTISLVNTEFEKLSGYSIAEVEGKKSWAEFVVEDDVERMKEYHFSRRIDPDSSPKSYEFRFIDAQGGIREAFLSISMIPGAKRSVASIQDITEKKRLEAQLQQAQKMEAIGTLAGGIAHDFNNLLTAVQGNASLMLMHIDPGNDEYERLKNIEKCVQSGAVLTKQLLGFARGGSYDVRPIDLGDLVRKSAEMFGRTKKEIAIHEKYPDDLWIVEADSTQIEQVLLNLYVNAWQAMPAGGDLYLETKNVDLDEDYVRVYEMGPGRYVKVSVTDTGVGMDEATRTRIFDPFFTTKEMGRGTGLGLASAYGIIRHHKGIINVYSEKGHGTTFSIYLPASHAALSDRGAQTREDEVLRGEGTILLVDDEEMIIDIATQMLQGLGYEVLSAGSGQEAVEVYKENRDIIDLVILDMIMPGMGGGQTYDMLKDVNPDISVILSSGYSINGQASAILERGCKGFIQKPYNMKALSKNIRAVLG